MLDGMDPSTDTGTGTDPQRRRRDRRRWPAGPPPHGTTRNDMAGGPGPRRAS
jgi:hypothetical protein